MATPKVFMHSVGVGVWLKNRFGKNSLTKLFFSQEEPQKDLDLRYGLDPNGKRKGQMLPYK